MNNRTLLWSVVGFSGGGLIALAGVVAVVVWKNRADADKLAESRATTQSGVNQAPPRQDQPARQPASDTEISLRVRPGGGAGSEVISPDGKKESDPAKPVPDPDADLKKNAQDLHKYTAKLKETVPYDIKRFTDAGYKAESYEKDTRREWFMVVVLKVEPVYLHDKVTGEAKKYTRARMVRNDPPPPSVNSRGGITSVPIPFEWVSVVMLP